MLDFKDQTVIVTGGTRGIGAAITKIFLKSQAKVIATYVGNVKQARAFYEENADKNRLFIEQCDVSNASQVTLFFKDFEI